MSELPPPAVPIGIVVVNSTDIGSSQGMGNILVTAREIIEIDSGSISYVALIDVSGASDSSASTAAIDYDEIPRILSGIEYIRRIDAKSTVFKGFEASFTTKNGVRFSTFTDSRGRIVGSVAHGGRMAYFPSLPDFDRVRSLLAYAREYIDKHRHASTIPRLAQMIEVEGGPSIT